MEREGGRLFLRGVGPGRDKPYGWPEFRLYEGRFAGPHIALGQFYFRSLPA